MKWALSDDATDIYLVSSYLNILPSEARILADTNREDFAITLGFAIRKRKEMMVRL